MPSPFDRHAISPFDPLSRNHRARLARYGSAGGFNTLSGAVRAAEVKGTAGVLELPAGTPVG